MKNNELIAKIDAELKAQGINATPAQIESALAQVQSKQELNADDLENVAGGGVADIVKNIPGIIDTVKNLFGGGGDKGGSGGSGGGTTTTNTVNQTGNTNNQGVQANQQGEGTQKNVQSIQTQGDVTL